VGQGVALLSWILLQTVARSDVGLCSHLQAQPGKDLPPSASSGHRSSLAVGQSHSWLSSPETSPPLQPATSKHTSQMQWYSAVIPAIPEGDWKDGG
jgi:hypothetical protein